MPDNEKIEALESELLTASKYIEKVEEENKRMRDSLEMIEIMAENRESIYSKHICNIARQGLEKR